MELHELYPLHGQEALFRRVNKAIEADDSMLDGDLDNVFVRAHYYSVGASASQIIYQTLAVADRPVDSVSRILDYACGFGRVLRWLRAAFPEAYIKGVDADLRSVEAAAGLGIDTEHLDLELVAGLGDGFDLIWVGSLFTHLTRVESARTLRYLRDQLDPQGILIVTMAGTGVVDRVRSNVDDYGLTEAGIAELLRTFDEEGWGYADYSFRPGYGVSAVSPRGMYALLDECGLFPFLFQKGGWNSHQDVFACMRA